ncbi:MAG: hypothetical protein PHH01_03685 [Patescibacteria group bacterium]|nr:hypothetical protein [Patescibacteria group bacterium]
MPDEYQRRVEKIGVGEVTIPTPGDVIEAVCLAEKRWANFEPGEVLRPVVVYTDLLTGVRCTLTTNSNSASYYHHFVLNRETGLWLLDGRGPGAPHFSITIITHLDRFEVPRAEPVDPDVSDDEDEGEG